MHGFTLNERDDLNYFWECPNGVIAYIPLTFPMRLVICPERGDEHGSCKMISDNDFALGLDGEFIAEFLRFTHLRTEGEPPLAPATEEESVAPSALASSTTTPEPSEEE